MLEYLMLDSLTEAQEACFVEMGFLAHGESTFGSKVGYSGDKLLSVARTYATDPEKFLCVAVDAGRCVGVFAGHLGEFYFSYDKLARDVLWYVREEYRKIGVGLVLLDRFEDWARGRGVRVVYLSQDSGIHMDKFTRMMERRGYDLVGANYCLGVS